MTGRQLELDLELAPVRPRLYLVPLGDRRAASRLDPNGHRGLEDGDADVIHRGWGRPVTDVHVAGARL